MEELYVESFSTQATMEAEKPVSASIPAMGSESTQEANQQLAEVFQVVHQFTYYLDQLEKKLFQKYKNFADFEFLLRDMRDKLKEKKMDGMDQLLTNLEELMDVSEVVE